MATGHASLKIIWMTKNICNLYNIIGQANKENIFYEKKLKFNYKKQSDKTKKWNFLKIT